MSLILNQGEATQYTFPQGFSMEAVPFASRITESERAYQHGSIITSDQKLQSRPVRIWGTLFRSTRAAFRADLQEMKDACNMKESKLYAEDYWPNRYIVLNPVSFNGPYLVTLLAADVEALFSVTDPFWYSDTLTTISQTILANQVSFSIINNGLIDVNPIITYYPGDDQMRLRIQNDNDNGGKRMTYQGRIQSGDEIEFDCEGGTVKKNGANHIWHLTGAWLNLVNGNNRIRLWITGTVASSRIQIAFRERWI